MNSSSSTNNVLALLAFCLRFDRLTSLSKSSTAAGDDMIGSIRRVLVDQLSFLLSNSFTITSYSDDTKVTRNSLAMELLLWQQLTSSHEAALRRMLVEVGRYCSLFVRCVQRNQPNLAAETFDEEYEVCMLQLKRLVVLLSCLKYLPRSHRVRKSIESSLGLAIIRAAELDTLTPRPNPNSVKRTEQEDQDAFWTSSSTSKKRNPRSVHSRSSSSSSSSSSSDYSSRINNDDEDFWGGKSIHAMRALRASSSATLNCFSDEADDAVLDALDDHLTRLLAEVMSVDLAAMQQVRVRVELDDVIASWRRPQLLLDFYFMQSSSKDTQTLFRRFLRALFGVSDETVEDIRFADPANRLGYGIRFDSFKNFCGRMHLDRFDPELVDMWREGRTPHGGELLF